MVFPQTLKQTLSWLIARVWIKIFYLGNKIHLLDENLLSFSFVLYFLSPSVRTPLLLSSFYQRPKLVFQNSLYDIVKNESINPCWLQCWPKYLVLKISYVGIAQLFPWTGFLTLQAPIPQNGQTHSNNSWAICRRIVWVCLTILSNWRLKD